MQPGHYADQSNDDYQAAEATSKSRLDKMEEAPIHYWARYVDPNREPEVKTEALILGDAIHKAVLQPDLIDAHFFVLDEKHPSRPAERIVNAKNPSPESLALIRRWQDVDAAADGRIILKHEQYKTVLRTRDGAWRDPQIRNLLSHPNGRAEQSYFAVDPETGALMKCRPDWQILDEGMILDVKSTEDASPDGFAKSVENYRYHVQDPWYRDVVNTHYDGEAIEYFAFIAIEKAWPNAACIHYLEPEDVEDGRAAGRRNFLRILECQRTGVWPSYSDIPVPIRRPNWAKRERPFRRTY